MRLVKSLVVSVSRVAGSSPFAPVFLRDTVGSDSSSATKGSSVASVAGKKRLPAKPWANAPAEATARSIAPLQRAIAEIHVIFFSCVEALRVPARAQHVARRRAVRLDGQAQEGSGGPRGGAAG